MSIWNEEHYLSNNNLSRYSVSISLKCDEMRQKYVWICSKCSSILMIFQNVPQYPRYREYQLLAALPGPCHQKQDIRCWAGTLNSYFIIVVIFTHNSTTQFWSSSSHEEYFDTRHIWRSHIHFMWWVVGVGQINCTIQRINNH